MHTAKIGRSTTIPLFVVLSAGFTVAGVLVAFTVWITTMHSDVRQLKDNVSEIKADVKEIRTRCRNDSLLVHGD